MLSVVVHPTAAVARLPRRLMPWMFQSAVEAGGS